MDKKDKTMICSHCKCSGHDANFCFALIRYPEWWADRPRTDSKNEGRGRASQCSTEKGAGRDCGAVRVNAAQVIPKAQSEKVHQMGMT